MWTLVALFLLAVPGVVSAQAADVLRVGDQVIGRLGPGNETLRGGEYAAFYLLEGELGAEVLLRLNSDDFDALLAVYDSNGAVNLAVDDDSGGGSNAAIRLALPYTGYYIVVVTSYWAGETGAYTLSAEAAAPDPYGGVPGDLRVGQTVGGYLGPGSAVTGAGRYVAEHYLSGAAGQPVAIEARSIDFDVFVSLFGDDGELLAFDDDSGGGTDALLRHTLPYTGRYLLLVIAYEGGGAYQLSVWADQ